MISSLHGGAGDDGPIGPRLIRHLPEIDKIFTEPPLPPKPSNKECGYLYTHPHLTKRLPVDLLDFDGVVTNPEWRDKYFREHDPSKSNFCIVTGRCFDEAPQVHQFLIEHLGEVPVVYFNNIYFADRGRGTIHSRTQSAQHKARIGYRFTRHGVFIRNIYEDDPLQIKTMREAYEKSIYPFLGNRIIHVPGNHSY